MKGMIWLTDDKGARLALLDQVTSWRYVKVANGIGSFSITTPADSLTNWLRPDRLLLFYPDLGYAGLDFIGFLRQWTVQTDQNGAESLILSGPDQHDLLRRRIVAYTAGSTGASLTGSTLADDGMKDIFNENFLAGASGDRDISGLGLTVAGDTSAGPNLDKWFAWRRVIDVLKDLNLASRAAGTEVFFKLAFTGFDAGGPQFEFQTATGQPGHDLTQYVSFSLAMGNLETPTLVQDHMVEENYIYAGGQGEGDERDIQEIEDTDRSGASQWNRCEGFAEARSAETSDGVTAVGQARLARFAPRRHFYGWILHDEQTPYGEAWRHGDRVAVYYKNHHVDGVVRRVEVAGSADTLHVRGYIEEEL